MSQATKRVKWCMDQAKKHIAEGRKHRGLVEVKPSAAAAVKHLEKAEHNLQSVVYNAKGGFTDWAVSAAFYSMYHCFLAILARFGYESRNQTCTVALVEVLKEEGKVDIDERFIKMLQEDSQEGQEFRVIELREEYTYGFKVAAQEVDIKKLTEACKELIDKTKSIVHS